jgi:hypothetical protein
MAQLARILVAFVLIGVAAFCVFGFLASAEIPSNANVFRIGYGAIGIASLAGAGWQLWPRKR